MDYDTLFGERRLHERKSCTLSITIDDYNRHYSGYLVNLSRSGALIEPSSIFKAKIGQEVMLTIPYATKKGATTIKGTVVRKRSDGLVITFVR
jgi:Tfp pilus assembly protein PilZ